MNIRCHKFHETNNHVYLTLDDNTYENANILSDLNVYFNLYESFIKIHNPNDVCILHSAASSIIDLIIENLPNYVTHLSLNFKSTKPSPSDANILDNLPSTLIGLNLNDSKIDEVQHIIDILSNVPNSRRTDSMTYESKILYKTNLWNGNVDHLPISLIRLTFGYYFNKPVDNLPRSLKSLLFGNDFNNSVDNLPSDLEILAFGQNFNNSVDNLPNNLKTLVFGNKFNKSIDNLPNSIVNLGFGEDFSYQINNLPHSIQTLTITSSNKIEFTNLPSNITGIRICRDFFETDGYANDYFDEKNKYFDHIYIQTNKFEQKLSQIPNTVEYLYINSKLSENLDLSATSVKYIVFGHKFEHNTIKFPKTLLKLKMKDLTFEF